MSTSSPAYAIGASTAAGPQQFTCERVERERVPVEAAGHEDEVVDDERRRFRASPDARRGPCGPGGKGAPEPDCERDYSVQRPCLTLVVVVSRGGDEEHVEIGRVARP
jgi:hypothetical protein